ncbi:MAG: ribosome-associated translation inhibitor RaiA [Alphaproteobacteria bacterium]|nr:ribosome-associated translation inhibitor RaiA [Alphaproteobacteria bacterium]
MVVRVTGKNMDVGDSLRAKAEEVIEAAVVKYFDGGYEGLLTIEHEGTGFSAECILHLDSGADLHAGAIAGDATAAFEDMAGHIEKRLRRYKRKLKSHRRKDGAAALAAQSYVLASTDEHDELAEDYSPPIIAESTENLEQMSIAEAVMALDLRQSSVVVFRHAGHGGLNVVYRRPDGNIGWIDPALNTD